MALKEDLKIVNVVKLVNIVELATIDRDDCFRFWDYFFFFRDIIFESRTSFVHVVCTVLNVWFRP